MSTTRIIHKMRVTRILDHTPSIRELILKSEGAEDFRFRTGQFAMLHVPNKADIAQKPSLRAYSITSDDRETRGFRLLFKHVAGGVASTFVWALKGDEVLDFTGPFGRVYFVEPPAQQIVFLSTGTGLAPHLSYLESKAEKYPDLQYRLYFGLQAEEDIFCLHDLNHFKSRLKNFDFHIVLSRPSSSWTGKTGYIQNHLKDFDFMKTETHFYLCGNRNMIAETKQLLQDKNFDATRIFSEAFD